MTSSDEFDPDFPPQVQRVPSNDVLDELNPSRTDDEPTSSPRVGLLVTGDAIRAARSTLSRPRRTIIDTSPLDSWGEADNPDEREWPPEVTVTYKKSSHACVNCGEDLYVDPGPAALWVHADGVDKCPRGGTWARA